MKKSLIGKNLDEFSDLCLELGVENGVSTRKFLKVCSEKNGKLYSGKNK